MRPNELGGVTYEGKEIPVVIAAAAHQDERFADYLREAAQDRLREQKIKQAGIKINPLEPPKMFGPGNFFEREEIIDNTKVKVPELPVWPQHNTKVYGHLMESLGAGLLLKSQRRVARRILVEAGLEPPKLWERIARHRPLRNLIYR